MTTDRVILIRAARMLERDAAAARESCRNGMALWVCGNCVRSGKADKCSAQRTYEKQVATAKDLRRIAK